MTAAQRPEPDVRHHFEQNIHVRHRLNRHRAGRAMDYGTDGPADLAVALAQELGGARRTATLLAEML